MTKMCWEGIRLHLLTQENLVNQPRSAKSLFNHCAGQNATSPVCWLPTCMDQMRWGSQCCGRRT